MADDTLLFVTQVAPYLDGPAGVHGVLDQAAVGVSPRSRSCTDSAAGGSTTCATSTTTRSRGAARSPCSRSARRRGAAVSGVLRPRPGARRRARHRRDPFGDGLVLRRGTSTACSSVPASTAIRGPRRSRSTCSSAPIPPPGTSPASWRWYDEVYQFRDLRPDARVLLRVPDDAARPPTRPARSARRSATRCRGASPRAPGGSFSTSLGHFPGAWESPAYLRHLAGGLSWALGEGGSCAAPDDVRRATSRRGRTGCCGSRPRSRATRARPSDPAAIPAWRDRCRDRLADLLGAPAGPGSRSTSRCARSVDCGTYRRESIVFDTEAAMSVPAFLLVPARPHSSRGRRSSRSTVTDPGKSEVCGLDDDESRDAIAEHHGDYAHQLAMRGYVVLAPDLRCFGERRRLEPARQVRVRRQPRARDRRRRQPARPEPLGPRVARSTCSSEHPLVDPDRIGMVGLSYGGTATLFLAAWDERVRAAVVSGYFNEWQACHRVPWNLCGSQVLPGMLGELEHVDLGALDRAAPAARRDRDRGPDLPGRGGARARWRGSRRSTTRSACPTGSSTTSSRAATAGTAYARTGSSTAGWGRPRSGPERVRRGCSLTSMSYEARLTELGIALPGPFPPHDPLDPVVVYGGAARTSGCLPRNADGVLHATGPARRRRDDRDRRRVRAAGARSTRCRCCGPSSGRSTGSSGCSR